MASTSGVAERRDRVPWLQALVLAALPLLIASHPFLYYSSNSRRGYSRNIRPLACGTKQGDTGVCMFAWDCMKANGTHLGTCIDRFYFGSCCKLKPGTPKPVHTPMKTNFTIHATTTTPEAQTMPTDSDSANEIEDSLQPVESASQSSGSNLMQLMIGEATVKPDSGSLLPELVETSTSFPVTGDQDESFAVVDTPTEQEVDQTLVSGGLPMQEIEQQMQHEMSGQSQNTQENAEHEDEKVDFISDSQQQVDVSIDPNEMIPAELENIDSQEEQQPHEGVLESSTSDGQDSGVLPEEIEQENNSQSAAIDINLIDHFVNEMIQSENGGIDDTSDSESVTEGQLPPAGGETELSDAVGSADVVEQTGSLDAGVDSITNADEEKLTSSSENDIPATDEQTSDQPTIDEQLDEGVQEADADSDATMTTERPTEAEVSDVTVEENQIDTGEVQQDSDLEEGDEQNTENEQDNEQIPPSETQIIAEQTPDSTGSMPSDSDDEGTTSVDEQTTEDNQIQDSTVDSDDIEATTIGSQISITDGESDGEENANQSSESSGPLGDPNLEDETLDVTTDQTFTTDSLESTFVSTTGDSVSAVTETEVLGETTEAAELESNEPNIQEETESTMAQDGDDIEISSDDADQGDFVQSTTVKSVIPGNEEDNAAPEQQTEEITSDNEDDHQQIDEGSKPGIPESSGVTTNPESDGEQTSEVEQGEQVDTEEQEDPVLDDQNELQNELDSTDQEKPSDMTPDSASQIIQGGTTPEETSSTIDDISGTDSAQSDIITVTDGTDQAQGDVTEEPDNKVDNHEVQVTQEDQPATVDSSSEVPDTTESTTELTLADESSENQGQTTTSPAAEDSFIVPGVQIISEPGYEVDETIPDKIEISTTESDTDDETSATESTTQNDLSISDQSDDDDMKQTEESEAEQEESTTEKLPTASVEPEIESSAETTSSDQIQTTEAALSEQVNATSDSSIEIAKPDSTGQVVIGIDAPLKNKTETPPGSDETVFETQEDQILHRLNSSSFRDICGQPVYPSKRIVGGSQATFGEWPWQVSLRQWRSVTYLHKCGAALVNENWAITAAHCVENAQPDQILLRLGEYDLERVDEPYGHLERKVQIIATHPQFDPRTFEYDLALLRFSEPVTFQPNIIPICIPSDDYDFIGDTGFVSGWGRLYEDGPLPSVMQKVPVPVITNSECEVMYRNAGYIEDIPNIFICAGYEGGKRDSCEGDSGGPLVIQHKNSWMLAGVISWGIGCALPNQPGVYTRISAFRDWINKIIVF